MKASLCIIKIELFLFSNSNLNKNSPDKIQHNFIASHTSREIPPKTIHFLHPVSYRHLDRILIEPSKSSLHFHEDFHKISYLFLCHTQQWIILGGTLINLRVGFSLRIFCCRFLLQVPRINGIKYNINFFLLCRSLVLKGHRATILEDDVFGIVNMKWNGIIGLWCNQVRIEGWRR